MTHPILDDMNWRYTTKRYDKTRRVPAEDLAVFYEAMRLSPSSINSQPWKFVVIESDEAKARLEKTFSERFQFNQRHVFESSQVILFAHNPRYTRDDYAKVVDKGIEDGRTLPENRDGAFGAFIFAELNTDETGSTECWTRAQTYIALGNALHTLARLKIDSTPLEGIDSGLIAQEFEKELAGYICVVALAIGYRHPEDDYNEKLPKSRLSEERVFIHL
jgi:nitroreductase/dihydropteridine reductase